jgi:hypothetical protein
MEGKMPISSAPEVATLELRIGLTHLAPESRRTVVKHIIYKLIAEGILQEDEDLVTLIAIDESCEECFSPNEYLEELKKQNEERLKEQWEKE